ncbi:hypothetical protein F5141DRAFT_1070020 [Pisolithus sp. B1]|nr:hypothetical protein F5141DRAFT_1070020 [Pisolithus sp. B1]
MHVDVPVDAIIPDGVPSYDAMPELTSVMREPPSWHVGFFGGVWKRLVGNVPASGVLVTLDSMINMIKRVWQESKEGRTRMMIDVLLLLQEKAIKHDETLPRNTWRSCMQANAEGMQNQKSPQVVAMPALPMAFNKMDPKQGGDNYEAAYAEVQYSSSNNKFATNAPDPEEGGDGKEATHQELGYSSGADKSMYDTEDPREDMDWEEESGGEFEDPLYIWPLEEYSSGTQGESVQPKATDIKGKKKQLLGLENTKQLPQIISEEEITAWDPGSGPCCTVDNFSVDLQGYVHSKWNRSAAQVFAMEYLKHYKGKNHMLEFMAEAWLTWVAGMKAQYKHLQQDKVLYKCHLNTACQYANIKDQAICIVQSLGLDGMSSNESDHEGHNGEATYYILDKDWHSQCEWQATSSTWPHFRTSSLKESVRAAVRELPSDFYSHNWYQAQNNFMKGQLKVTKPSVSLEVPTKYLKLLEWYNLSDCWVVQLTGDALEMSHCLSSIFIVILPNSTFCSIDNSQWHQVPLVTLPDALLQTVLSANVAKLDYIHAFLRLAMLHDSTVLRVLNQVCGRWQAIVLEDPLLWHKMLNLTGGQKWVREVVMQTKDMPLWVHINQYDFTEDYGKNIMPNVNLVTSNHFSRCAIFDIKGHSGKVEEILEAVNTDYGAPLIHSLSIQNISCSVQEHLVNIPDRLLKTMMPCLTLLHNVTLAMMLLQLSLILQSFPLLTDLQLQDVITVMAGNLGTTLVALQGLSSLHIWSSIDACTIFLGTICAPSLVDLVVDVNTAPQPSPSDIQELMTRKVTLTLIYKYRVFVDMILDLHVSIAGLPTTEALLQQCAHESFSDLDVIHNQIMAWAISLGDTDILDWVTKVVEDEGSIDDILD